MGNQMILDGVATENSVTHVADDDALPGNGTITVSLSRWLDEKPALLKRGNCGVRLTGADDPSKLLNDLQSVALIAIEFPAFTDGRGYSHARLLRSRHGYNGELRAIGDVGQDQLQPLHRCGFNAFELRDDLRADDAIDGLDDFSVSYQAAADQEAALFRHVQR